MRQTSVLIRKFTFVALSFVIALASCSKKDSGPSVATAAFAGQYLVVEESETYTMKIENVSGNNFEIKNFGGFMNVPVKATVNGTTLNISAQTFTNPSGKTLTVTGTATLATKDAKDDTINFNYTVTGFANYTSTFEGARQ